MLRTTALRKVFLISLLILLITSQAGTVSAGTNVWTSNGPEGGEIFALAIDPATPSTLYAGNYNGNVFKSTNSGGDWSVVNTGLPGTDVRALAIDLTNPSTLYAGTNGRGVYKSTNNGGDWSATGLTNTYVRALAIDPTTPSTLYAGDYSYSGGVFKSTNGGGNWNAVNTGLTNTLVSALAIDPATPSTLYAGTSSGLGGGGVFKSTNGGGNWNAVNTGLTNTLVSALAIDPTTPGTLYAGTTGGVFKSTDSGGNWSAVNSGLTNTNVIALAIDPTNPSTLYAGTFGGGVFKSTNGGENWEAVNTGLTNTDVRTLAIDLVIPSTLYAGTNGGGVFAIQQIPPLTVAMTSLASDPTNASPIAVSVTFSESVNGFTSTDIVPTNGTISNFASDGANYTFDLTPAGQGFVTADIAAGVATNSAGIGNTIATQFSRTYDTVAPTGSVMIADSATYTASTSVSLTLSATDATSGVTQMSFSNDGSNWSTWESYATSKAWILSSGDGSKTVYARYQDNAGNISEPVTDTITLDTVAPTGSIVIAGGAAYAASTSVNLTLSAMDAANGLAQMSFSNDGSNWSAWESYATSKAWILSSTDGSKTVYARYQDNAGNISDPVTDTIALDTTPPSASASALDAYQTSLTFTISWSGTDTISGIANYDVQFRDGSTGTWTDWITATTATSATFTGQDDHTYFFRTRARDNMGNISAYSSGDTQTTLDVTPPTPGDLTINGGALTTTATDVTLSLSATDVTSGVAMMSFSNDGNAWSEWQSYAAHASWALVSGDGLKTVYARFRDVAGNDSSSVSDTIVLDTTMGAEYGVTINAGAIFTNQTAVTLTISARPETAQMQVSNDGGFAGAQWEPYASHKAWVITQYGSYVIPRVVYVRYKNIAGNVSSNYQDDIILDVTPPEGAVSIIGATGFQAMASTVTLELSATDDVSGVGQMLISNQPDFADTTWESYATSRVWVLGSSGTVYVRFRDNAGNVSTTYLASSPSNWNIFLPLILK